MKRTAMPKEFSLVLTSGQAQLTDQIRGEWDIFYQIDQLLEQRFGKVGGPRFIAKLYEDIVLRIFIHTIRFGAFRLPSGIGTLRLQRAKPAYYRKNTGKSGRRPPSIKLVFMEGESVAVALGRPGKTSMKAKQPPKLAQLVVEKAREQVVGLVQVAEADLTRELQPRGQS